MVSKEAYKHTVKFTNLASCLAASWACLAVVVAVAVVGLAVEEEAQRPAADHQFAAVRDQAG